MRFLQTEWHRHERDRNAWEIERAEMRSRIGRLEGDVRTSKRLHESLGKHVRLLEAALKKEREKVKKLSNNEPIEDMRDSKEIARESINALKCTIPACKIPSAGGLLTCLQRNGPNPRPISPPILTPTTNLASDRRTNGRSRVCICQNARKRLHFTLSLLRILLPI